MKKQIITRFGFILGFIILISFFTVPSKYFGDNSFSKKLQEYKVVLGLDLAGGTELDYKIDLTEALKQNNDQDELNNVDINNIAESVRDALEKRVNPAGVGEIIVKRSQVNDEEHVLIQMPPSSNVEKAKKDAERNNKLEFFEENPALETKTRLKINEQLKLTNEKNWNKKLDELVDKEKIIHEKVDFRFQDEIQDQALAKKIFEAEPNSILDTVIETRTEMEMEDENGTMVLKKFPKNVLAIVKVGEKKDVDREKTIPAEVEAQHILFAYPEAMRAINYDSNKFDTLDLAVEDARQIVANNDEKKLEEEYEKILEKEKIVRQFDAAATDDEKQKIVFDKEKYESLDIFIEESKKFLEEQSTKDAKIAFQDYKKAKNLIKNYEEFPYKTKEDAQKKAQEILEKLKKEGTENFADLAKEFSTEAAAKTSGGNLGKFGKGKMVKPFEEAVFALEEPKLLDNIIETDFGFHVIDVTQIQKEKKETKKEPKINYEMIAWDKEEINWELTKLDGSKLENAKVGYNELGKPLVNLYFNTEGAKLFGKITEKVASKKCNNTLCRLGIKVGGEWITRPTVSEKIIGRSAQITGNFTYESAQDLAHGLNLGAIDAPVILSGQINIQPELGQIQLQKSLKAATIGFLATMFFMIIIYRFAGIIASIALSIYAGAFITILKIWPENFGGPIVLTLAGVAGIALSIGLAVDGNILIFERMKEEIEKGRSFFQAVDLGFERAWTAIRDSNLTTLLTCIILFFMGSSMIKGFAITLIVGTILSMFTAITISRNLIRFFLLFKCFQKPWLFGIKKSKK